MPGMSFHDSLQALTAKQPVVYEDIVKLYQEHVPRVADRQEKLSDMTIDVMEHLAPCAILCVLIPVPKVPDEYIEHFFWMHTLGSAEYDDLAIVLRLIASCRYVIFDRLVTKMAILETVHEEHPDILDRLKEPAEV